MSPGQVSVTTDDEAARGPPCSTRVRVELGPGICRRIVFPELAVVQWAVVVPVSTEDIPLPILVKLGAGHPGLPGEVVELGPGVRRRIIGVEVFVNGERSVLGVAVAEPDVGDAVDSELERMVPVAPFEGRQLRPAVGGDVVAPPVSEVAVVVAAEPDEDHAARHDQRRMVPARSGKRRPLRPRAGGHVEVPEIRGVGFTVGPEPDKGVVPTADATPVSTRTSRKRALSFPCVGRRVVAVNVVEVECGKTRLPCDDVSVLLVGHGDRMVAAIARGVVHLDPTVLGRHQGEETEGNEEKKEPAHGGNRHQRNL